MYRYPPAMCVCVMLVIGIAVGGCGMSWFSGGSDVVSTPPPGTEQAAKHAIGSAVRAMALPASVKGAVRIESETDSGSDEMAAVAVRDVLHARGMELTRAEDAPVTLTVRVDTLVVTLERSRKGSRKTISRTTIAETTAELAGPGDVRRVYRGRGEWHDSFNPAFRQSMDLDPPYVIDRTGDGTIKNRLKPVFIAVAITVFAWMLYSYRG